MGMLEATSVRYEYFRSVSQKVDTHTQLTMFLGFLMLTKYEKIANGNVEKTTECIQLSYTLPLKAIPISLSFIPMGDKKVILRKEEFYQLLDLSMREPVRLWAYFDVGPYTQVIKSNAN